MIDQSIVSGLFAIGGVVVGCGSSWLLWHLQRKESDRQRQWELKRDVVIDMIRAHADLDECMIEVGTIYSIPIERLSDADKNAHMQKLYETSLEWFRRAATYQRARNVADIAINGELSRAASAYFQNAHKLVELIIARKKVYDRNARRELVMLGNRLILATRKELNIPETEDLPIIDYDALQPEPAS